MSTRPNTRGSTAQELIKILPKEIHALAIIQPAIPKDNNTSLYNTKIEIVGTDDSDVATELENYIEKNSLLYHIATTYRKYQKNGKLYITPLQDNPSSDDSTITLSYASDVPTAGVTGEYKFSIGNAIYTIEVLSADNPSDVFGKMKDVVNANDSSLFIASDGAGGELIFTGTSNSLEFNNFGYNFDKLFSNFPSFDISVNEQVATLDPSISTALEQYVDTLCDINTIASRFQDLEDHLQEKFNDNPESGKKTGFGIIAKALTYAQLSSEIPYNNVRLTQIDGTIVTDNLDSLSLTYNHDYISHKSEIAILKYATLKNVRIEGELIDRYENTLLPTIGGPSSFSATTEDIIINGIKRGLYADNLSGKVFDIANAVIDKFEHLGYTYAKTDNLGVDLTSQTFMCADIYDSNPGRTLQQRLSANFQRLSFDDTLAKFCKNNEINANVDASLRRALVTDLINAVDLIGKTYVTFYRGDNLKAHKDVISNKTTVYRNGTTLYAEIPIRVNENFELYIASTKVQTYNS